MCSSPPSAQAAPSDLYATKNDEADPDWQLVSPRTLRDPNAPQSSAAAPLGPSSALKRIVQPRPEHMIAASVLTKAGLF
ncbi:uncharacterized protein JCM10292_007547 [Rhodotorula paludigena]|uniref:uncharacterized protein n=1 Tax=Rhodotorula paludigena TaxID=86838 RepID=UPI0031708319